MALKRSEDKEEEENQSGAGGAGCNHVDGSPYRETPIVSAGLRKPTRGGRRRIRTLTQSALFQSACACLQHWCTHFELNLCANYEKAISKPQPPGEAATEPFRRLYSMRETPKCTGGSLCISQCNTTVLDFSILLCGQVSLFQTTSNFVRKDCGQDLFFFLFMFPKDKSSSFDYFLVYFGVVFVHLAVGLSSTRPALILTLRCQVVSIMCEKCLLYSFKKFQAEYKTIYKSIYIYLFWRRAICLLGSTFWFRGLALVDGSGDLKRHNNLSRCQTQFLIPSHYFIPLFYNFGYW